MKPSHRTDYLKFLTAMLIFGTIGIFRRYIPLDSGVLAFARGAMGAVFLAVFVKVRGGHLRHGTARRTIGLLALTGALIGLNWMLLFEAYERIPVGTATLCYYMQPTIVVLLSAPIFCERLTRRRLLCALCAVLGMILVSGAAEGDGLRAGNLRGIAYALGAAALYATVIILNKLVTAGDVYERTVIQLGAAALVMLPYLGVTGGFRGASLTGKAIVLLLILGIVHTGIAYALYFGSMQRLKAQSLAVLSYLDPVFTLLLSALILREEMIAPGLLGAVLIIGSAIVSERQGAADTTQSQSA